MKNECVICEAPLEYLDTDVVMECVICHKKEYSKIRCINGHYVCNDCHMRGLNKIIGLCMETMRFLAATVRFSAASARLRCSSVLALSSIRQESNPLNHQEVILK